MRIMISVFAFLLIASSAYSQTANGNDWVLIVGIDRYQSLPGLTGAVKGAKLLGQELVKDFGIKQENITELYNDDATRSNILNAFDRLTDAQRVSKNDRILVFFAGHAVTRTVAGKDVGYLMPVDGVMEKLFGTAVSTEQIQEIEQASPAKQVFFCMDACYGGTIFTRGLGLIQPSDEESSSTGAYSAKASRVALTAGGKDEEVTDMADQGIDAFTYYLLQALNSASNVGNGKVITASELADYVAKNVRYRTSQHPEYGKLPGDGGGEYVFVRSTSTIAQTPPTPPPSQSQQPSNPNPSPSQVEAENPSQQPPPIQHPPTVTENRSETNQWWIYGFLGGNNNSYGMSLDYASIGTKAGGNLGLGAEYKFTPHFAIGLNLFFEDDKSGSGTYNDGAYLTGDFYDDYGYYYDEADVSNDNFTLQIEYVSINPQMKFSIGGAYADLGLSFGIVTKANWVIDNADVVLYNSYTENSTNSNLSANIKIPDVTTRIGMPIGVGYDLDMGHLRLFGELRYDIGLNDVASSTSGGVSSFQFILGAGFGF